ncbi:MAG: HAD-IIB family hydrolase [Vicinamibacteria bacterium]
MSTGSLPWLVASDLDGCLLDASSYSFEPAREALSLLRRRRVPLVLATSKTRAELRPLARALDIGAPAIVENGGALTIPKGHLRIVPGARQVRGFQLVELGVARERLVKALGEISAETGLRLRGFSAFGVRELRRLTGLDAEAARLALAREHDEPFLVEDPDPGDAAELVAASAQRRGLRVTRGGRFFHLHGETDKGRALVELLRLYAAEARRFRTLALGDAANDLELLRAAERAILVPRSDGTFDPALTRGLPGAERAHAPGPVGWNRAVLRAFAEG